MLLIGHYRFAFQGLVVIKLSSAVCFPEERLISRAGVGVINGGWLAKAIES